MKAGDDLVRGREARAARAWSDAANALTAADGQHPLGPGDLEALATALFMVGREEEYYATLERAHRGHLAAGSTRRAAYCAFWVGMQLMMRGEVGRGGGWLGRAHRLLEHEEDCGERGYLLLPETFQRQATGDVDGAAVAAATAADIARRFGDADLFALAVHRQGELLVSVGQVSEGLRLLDEAMLAVSAGEVSPIPSGIVYCTAIVCCQIAFDPRRAQEWTTALHEWCEAQPDMLAFTGDCHVHRAELMQLHGTWSDALQELDRAADRAGRAGNVRVAAHAALCRGEILRLRDDLQGAEDAYREAARGGVEPQPGLALLRLAHGDPAAAVAMIRRVLSETVGPSRRATLLTAAVEIMLAAGDLAAAREACAELESIGAGRASDMLAAMVAHTRGEVALAAGDPGGALSDLRCALAGWRELGVPYQAARVQLLIADACRSLGDEDSAAFDLAAARETLEALRAAREPPQPRDAHGLTGRELQVLKLVAAGATNKAIAAQLVLSERTVDRHVSNILAKLRVSSRAAATAYAYQHSLL